MIEHLDGWVGRLVERVRERGELDRTLIIFSSDHGEMLGDHGRWFKSTWHEPALRVPLIVAGPGVPAGARSDRPVELIDAAASVLAAAGLAVPEGWDAVPLAIGRDHTVSALGGWTTVADARWKLVRLGNGRRLLFDLGRDGRETEDLAERFPAEVARLDALAPATPP